MMVHITEGMKTWIDDTFKEISSQLVIVQIMQQAPRQQWMVEKFMTVKLFIDLRSIKLINL